MMMKINLLFKPSALLFALLLGALGAIGQVQAQMDHSSGMAGAMKTKSNDVCQGDGLQCANAATPFFAQDGRLLLAWTANGVVSVAQSMDLGKTFSPAVKIAEHGKSLDVGSDARPQIASDANGNIFLAYSFFKDANWNAQINTTRSTDGGNTFITPVSLVKDSSSQRFPSVLMNPNGNIFISWIDKRLVAAAKQGGEKRLGGSIAYSFSQDGGKSFEAERFANESSCECCRIGAALDPQGRPVIVYRAIFAGGIRDQASQVISGKGAGPVRRVADDDWKTDACPHHGPSIAVSGSGKLHVAWYTQGSKRSGVFYANSINQGASYSKPSRIGAEGSNVARPYLFAMGKHVWLVWKEFDGKKSSIYLKESSDDGNSWNSPRVLASTEGYSDHPLLLSHGDAVFLSWLTRADGYQLINVGHKK
ncbi:exo-alpha-sialidase [Polynucleobacter sp. AP-Capit-er-40B-B4]|uniref:sialidase family protein n=1 Tax=Polynucleobacter sp. AP-Capit-er-40B-B4 TaxID=2576927 RepID=UPI001C0D205B|nr:sialidase family protein [Polynucleobacter sp. AP-Capit-er-40B-B4]MBU3581386.1 exo-alpha-sialidase [Polynucleobacter sp. AP-Capit-er-40B-B4]